jgi:hypothetical protein
VGDADRRMTDRTRLTLLPLWRVELTIPFCGFGLVQDSSGARPCSRRLSQTRADPEFRSPRIRFLECTGLCPLRIRV